MRSITLCALLVIGMVLSGSMLSSCARKSVQSAPQLAPTPPVSQATETPAPAPAPTPPAVPAVQASDFQDVFFALDQFNLDAAARNALDADAKLLRDHPGLRITIEGHCDERGSVEYNLSLGERRAVATQNYLVGAGVSAGQMQTISYGKERPFCTESNETCWAKNRCAHILLR